jgi:hypothetical protein
MQPERKPENPEPILDTDSPSLGTATQPQQIQTNSAQAASDITKMRTLQTQLRDLQDCLEDFRLGNITLKDCKTTWEKASREIGDRVNALESQTTCQTLIGDFWCLVHVLIEELMTEEDMRFENLSKLTTIKDRLRKMIYCLSKKTVAARVNELLKGSRAGYVISFHETKEFLDLLPGPDDRTNLLTFFATEPGCVNGLIDAENGLIYRYADDPNERRAHFILVAFVFFASMLGIMLSTLLHIYSPAWRFAPTPDQIINLCTWWIALVIGILIHTAVDSTKRKRLPIVSIGELGLVIDAQYGDILVKLGLALFVFAGVNTFVPDLSMLSPFTYLLIGYSQDSFVGLFVQQASSITKIIQLQDGTQPSL